MTTYSDPSFLLDCPLPSLRFEAYQENQETLCHIRLYCNTIHHVLYVTDPNSPLHVSHHTQTHIQSRFCLHNQQQLERGLINVLSNWEIPEPYHQYILHSIHIQLHTLNTLPTPYFLRVGVRCHKFYCPNRNVFSQWCMMRWQERPVIEGTYPINEGMTPASESAIKSMVVRQKMKKGGVDEDSSCPICLEDFLEGSVTGCMPCSHMFHEECLTNWLRRSHYCPLCRLELPTMSLDLHD